MTIKTTLAVLILSVSPTLAMAMGCSEHPIRTSASCADGQTWDTASQTCVAGSIS